jgi:predicted amidophosphoribosyltransferase
MAHENRSPGARLCPHCGQPAPLRRQTCPQCGKSIQAINGVTGAQLAAVSPDARKGAESAAVEESDWVDRLLPTYD